MGDQFAFQTAGMVEVELLQCLAAREPGVTNPALAAERIPAATSRCRQATRNSSCDHARPGPAQRAARRAAPRCRATQALSTPGSNTRSRSPRPKCGCRPSSCDHLSVAKAIAPWRYFRSTTRGLSSRGSGLANRLAGGRGLVAVALAGRVSVGFDHQRRLSSRLNWHRSLTFLCDRSTRIHTQKAAEGRLRMGPCGVGKRVGFTPSRVRIPHPPLP